MGFKALVRRIFGGSPEGASGAGRLEPSLGESGEAPGREPRREPRFGERAGEFESYPELFPELEAWGSPKAMLKLAQEISMASHLGKARLSLELGMRRSAQARWVRDGWEVELASPAGPARCRARIQGDLAILSLPEGEARIGLSSGTVRYDSEFGSLEWSGEGKAKARPAASRREPERRRIAEPDRRSDPFDPLGDLERSRARWGEAEGEAPIREGGFRAGGGAFGGGGASGAWDAPGEPGRPGERPAPSGIPAAIALGSALEPERLHASDALAEPMRGEDWGAGETPARELECGPDWSAGAEGDLGDLAQSAGEEPTGY